MRERYLSVREFAELLGVSRSTVISWIKSKRIVVYNVHGRWKIPYSEVEKILRGVQRIRRLAIYARVSSNTQKDDLERQVEALKLWIAKNFPQAEYVVVTDIASGLNEDRSGLKKLIEVARRAREGESGEGGEDDFEGGEGLWWSRREGRGWCDKHRAEVSVLEWEARGVGLDWRS
jgi:excisionase family DNA binding protein